MHTFLKILRLLFRYLVLIALCYFLWQLFSQQSGFFFQKTRVLADLAPSRLKLYGLSCGIFLSLYLIYVRKMLKFWEVFVHEITHVVFAGLFLHKIEGFSVSVTNGISRYNGRTNWVITLAPWTFPLLVWLFLSIGLMIDDQYAAYFHHATALSLTWHFASAIRGFSLRENDIQDYGIVFAVLFIIAANTANLVFFVYYLQGDLGALADLTQQVVASWEVPWS